MTDFIIAPLLIFILFGIWILVQYLARAFAAAHPELGPYREEGGCGSGSCHSCGSANRDECAKDVTKNSV